MAPGDLSQQVGSQGGPSPCMLGEMVQECSSSLCLGSVHCILAPVLMDTAVSALVQEMGDAWTLVLWLHPGDFRSSPNLLTGLGMGGMEGSRQGQAT